MGSCCLHLREIPLDGRDIQFCFLLCFYLVRWIFLVRMKCYGIIHASFVSRMRQTISNFYLHRMLVLRGAIVSTWRASDCAVWKLVWYFTFQIHEHRFLHDDISSCLRYSTYYVCTDTATNQTMWRELPITWAPWADLRVMIGWLVW